VTFSVDTHYDMLPDFFWRATTRPTARSAASRRRPGHARARCRSSTTPASTSPSPRSAPRPAHRRRRRGPRTGPACNELAADMIRDRPGRFGGFACLPLPDVEGALAELAYALDDLGLDGVLPFSNARGILLGGPAVHPRCSTSCNGARPWCSRILIARPIPAPTRSNCPTRLSTSLPIPPGPSPSCITAAPSPAPPTSRTSSPAPDVPRPTWPGGSASSNKYASSPEPRAARPRPRHSAACTGILRRAG
jgi:Amidohydrolase